MVRNALIVGSLAAVACLGAAATDAHAATSPWRIVASPNLGSPSPRNVNELGGVAADSTRDAWAIGDANHVPLVEHWNGGSWKVVQTPALAGDRLDGVTASSATNVTITAETGGASVAVLHYSGSSWTRTVLPPAPERLATSMATALSATDVWDGAFSVNDTTGAEDLYLEHWNGIAWQSTLVNQLVVDSNALVSIHPISDTDVWLDTSEQIVTAGQPDQTFGVVYQWNGSTVIDRGMGPQSPSRQRSWAVDLRGIGSSSASDVWVVGDWWSTDADPLAGQWEGGTQGSSPVLNFYATRHYADGIAVGSPSNVWVVGYRVTDGSAPGPWGGAAVYNLLEHWNGLSWAEWGGPNPTNNTQLSAVVAVPHSSQFWAVGRTAGRTMILRCCS
jgi:hypothetical protein